MERADTLFIRIDDPVSWRRSLLENSREIISSLQSYESLRLIREAKIKNVFALKNFMIEINKLCFDLEQNLPLQDIGKERKHEPADKDEKSQIKVKSSRKKEAIPRIKPRSELQRLEEELNDIESKLEGLHR